MNAKSVNSKTTQAKPPKQIDWRKKFNDPKQPKLAKLETDFAGIKAGNTLFIATPGILANYISRIPKGETRTIERLRNELARQHLAQATCPVTTAIFLRIVCEAAWDQYVESGSTEHIIPFWRAIEPKSKIAARLRCDSEWIALQRELEQTS
jgi:hypothetical protein